MSIINDKKNEKGTILVNYKDLLDELIDETRKLLLEKKRKNNQVKRKYQNFLFDQFIYVHSLRNSAKTELEYKEAYETLTESLQKFREQSAWRIKNKSF